MCFVFRNMGEAMEGQKFLSGQAGMIIALTIGVLAFQNCSQTRFSTDTNSVQSRSAGDDGQLVGGRPGDDANTPPKRPGDDGVTPQQQQVCDERYAAVIQGHVPKSLCASATTVRFLAGQHYYVGDVSIAAKSGQLKVLISLIGNVTMAESHVDVASSPSALQTSPGQFQYKAIHSPAVTQYTYSIPLSDENFVVGQTIYARVHAAVKPGKDAILCSEETAWAQGIRSGIGWSMHVPITLQECP